MGAADEVNKTADASGAQADPLAAEADVDTHDQEPVEDYAAAGPPAPEGADSPRDDPDHAEELERHSQPGNR